MFEDLPEDWITYQRNLWRNRPGVRAGYRFGPWPYRFSYSATHAPLSFLYKLFLLMPILSGIKVPCEIRSHASKAEIAAELIH